MNIKPEVFSKLTTLMFSASLDQSKWSDFLEYLAKSTGVRPFMLGHDIEYNKSFDIYSKSHDPEFIKSFDEYYGAMNPWISNASDIPLGRPVLGEAMVSRAALEKTEFYNDWILPQEDIVAGAGAVLFSDRSRIVVVGGNIRKKDEHIENNWVDILGMIIPHLQSALEINRLLAVEKIGKFVGYNDLNAVDTAILLINNFGKIVFANMNAQSLLEKGSIIKSNYRRHLKFDNFIPEVEFRKSIHSLNKMGADVSSKFDCFRQVDQNTYSCRTFRFDPRSHDISPFGILVSVHEPCIMLTINKIAKKIPAQLELMERFNLTPSEIDVVLSISQGLSTQEIAGKRKVSIYTIRNQRKSAMGKMDVRKQIEMVNLLNKNIKIAG